jgi:NAD(P)-dependent dehydrogenase (short-subunit alcohol dehydrogenase family)
LKTLQQVVDFIGSGTSVASVVSPVVDVTAILLAVVSELTGYPAQTLQLGMALEADLGIDSNKRLELLTALARRVPSARSVNAENISKIRTLQQILDALASSHPEVADGLSRRVVVAVRAPAGEPVVLPAGSIAIFGEDSALASALVQRLQRSGSAAVHVASLEELPAELAGVLVLAQKRSEWSSATEAALKRALMLARAVGPKLKVAGKNAFFVTVTRRDGAFGLSSEPLGGNPLDGGLAGLAKTAAHEWPFARCRALDVSQVFDDAAAADAIVEELTNDGPRELGLGPAGRLTLSTREEPVTKQAPALQRGEVVVVTGGGRGVTAECARALAQATGVTLVLLGRSPSPQPEAEWLSDAADEASIKRVLLEHATGEKPTPRLLGERTKAVLAAREIRASLLALEQLGLRAEYRSVDVRDEAAVAALLADVRVSLGPVRGLVHGAGVLRDRRIEDKRDDDFDQVLDPKIAGARALLKAARADELRFIALFASVTGRFGRRGQADYAVANQALVSIARDEAARRRDCRVVAFDWGPWEGGMVNAALKAEFEKEGISLIPLAAGAKAMVDEVSSPAGGPIEVVFGAGFGEEAPASWAAQRAYRLEASWPVLADHRLAGRSVLPLAVTLEWFAQAFSARVALEDVRVLKGVTVGAAPEDVVVWVSAPERTLHGVRHQVELRNAKDQVHVRAVAVHEAQERPVALALPGGLRPYVQTMASTYSEQLFHGPSLQVIEAIEGVSDQGMTLKMRGPVTSATLLPGEARRWATNPVIIDGVFQALIVWCRAQRGAPSLPSRLGAWRQFADLGEGAVRVVVRVREVDGATVTSDVDVLDEGGHVMARLDGYVCTVSPSLDRAFGLDAAVSSVVVPTA